MLITMPPSPGLCGAAPPSGEHQWLGVQALADGGRFLEVGKVRGWD